jgi:hypothetical protein
MLALLSTRHGSGSILVCPRQWFSSGSHSSVRTAPVDSGSASVRFRCSSNKVIRLHRVIAVVLVLVVAVAVVVAIVVVVVVVVVVIVAVVVAAAAAVVLVVHALQLSVAYCFGCCYCSYCFCCPCSAIHQD